MAETPFGDSHALVPKLCEELWEKRGENIAVVQVGANDGKIADPLLRTIRKFGWRALLIEPVPFYFEQLERLHSGHQNISLVRMAVDKESAERVMYVADPSQTPQDKPWWKGVASFRKAHLLNHNLPNGAILEISVNTAPLSVIMSENNFKTCDLLCVDVEGHELPVLETFDFQRHSPALVIFEAKHMSTHQYGLASRWLDQLGYSTVRLHPDAIAIHRDSGLAIN